MSKGLIFWLLMIIWLVLAIFSGWRSSTPGAPAYTWGDTILLFALLFLLGWSVFGFIVQ